MHRHHFRLLIAAVAALFLAEAVAASGAAIEDKMGGRRRGSFRSLSGNPDAVPSMFRHTVFDPDLFAATCVPPADATAGTGEGPMCRELRGAFDHVAAGIGLRHAGFGSIALRGAPSGAAVIAARLFWSIIADQQIAEEADGSSMGVSFQGHGVTGERVGATEELCWESGGFSVHYSADVTHLVPDAVNGDYEVSGVPTTVTDGHDPFHDLENPALPWAQGASLIVVYTHADAGGRVDLHEGAELLTNVLELELDLSPPLPEEGATVVRHTRIGGDGQTHDGEPLFAYATFLGQDQENGATLQIRGPGSALDPSPDWQGRDGAPLPGLWDTQSDEPWAPLLGSGAASYRVWWQAVTEGGGEGTSAARILTKLEDPEPPPPEPEPYDCVYVGAVVMTTTTR